MFHLRPIFSKETTAQAHNQDTKDKITSSLYELHTKSGKLFSELNTRQADSLNSPQIIARLEDIHDLAIYLNNLIHPSPCQQTLN